MQYVDVTNRQVCYWQQNIGPKKTMAVEVVDENEGAGEKL